MTDLRLRALELACGSPDATSAVVERAVAYYDFLRGTAPQSGAQAVPPPPPLSQRCAWWEALEGDVRHARLRMH